MRVLALLLALGLPGGWPAGAAEPELTPEQAGLTAAPTEKAVTQVPQGASASVAVGGSIWSVIIGINYLGNDEIPDLHYAEDDAARFKQTLIEVSQGLITDTRTRVLAGTSSPAASRNEIIRAVKAAAENAGPQDTILLYFSGHGVTDGEANYLVPVDGVADLPEDSSVPVTRIFELLDASAAARTVIFLDACHSGGVRAGTKEVTQRGAMEEAFARQLLAEARGRVVLSSSGIDQVSLESAETGGVFTHYLCEGLRGPANSNGDGYITVSEIAAYVTERVREWSFQNNENMTPVLSGAAMGDIPLVVVEAPEQVYAYAAPQAVDAESLLIERELSFDELQSALNVQEELAQAKVILYGSREEASLNVEFRSDLKLPQIHEAIGHLDTYLKTYSDSPEGYRNLALAQWLAAGLEAAKPDGAEFFGLLDSRALPPVERAIELEPGNPANVLLKAQILLQRQDYAGAIAAARQALVLNPDLVYGYTTWGMAHIQQGALSEALRVVQTGVQKFPHNPHVWKLMADVYLMRGQPTAALDPLLTAEKLYDEVGTGYYAVLAYFLENLGGAYYWTDRDKSLQCYQRALDTIVAHEEEEQDNPYYHKYYGSLNRDLNQPVEYRQGVMRAYEMDPEDPYVLADRGAYYLYITNETLALTDVQAALELDNGQAYMWAILSDIQQARGDLAGAQASLTEALALMPECLAYYISRGSLKLRQGDSSGAEEDFHRALTAAPEDCDLLNQVALAYDAAGQWERAIEHFERAHAARANPLYRYNLAVTYYDQQDYEKARQEIDTALAGNPDNADFLNMAGKIALARGDEAAALDYYQRAAAKQRSLWHQVDLAKLLTSTGAAEAPAAWDALVEVYAGYVDAWLERGWHYYETERYEEALSDYRQALALVPEDEESENRLAITLAAQGDSAAAEQHYRNALALNPNTTIYTNLIDLLSVDPARVAEVEQLWAEMLERFPTDVEALIANGDRLYDAQSYGAAAEVFARGAVAHPTDARFLNRQGMCLFMQGKLAEAAELYQASLALKYEPEVVSNYASALALAGQTAEADAVWQQYMQQHPADAALVMEYALALYTAEDNEGALQLYLRGQTLEPDNDEFYNRAGLCLFNLNRVAEAVEQVKRALELRAEPVYYYNLAYGYEELGDPATAERYYREGLELFPDYADLADGLGNLLSAQGRSGEALELMLETAERTGDAYLFARAASIAQELGEWDLAESVYGVAIKLSPEEGWLAVEYALFLAMGERRQELAAYLEGIHGRLSAEDYGWVLDELSSYWLDTEQYDVAVGFMEELIQRNPREPTAYNILALAQYLSGDMEQALATVKRGLNDAGRNSLGLYLEATLTWQLHGLDAAMPLAQALLNDPEGGEEAYTLYLDMLAEQEDYSAQAEVAKRGLEQYPLSATLLQYGALALYYMDDLTGAINLLTDERYLAAEYFGRDELLGLCYYEQGNYVKAVAHLTAACALEPERADLLATLAGAQYLMGEAPEAHKSADRALALDADQAEAHLWRGFALLAAGDLAGAEAEFTLVRGSPTALTASLGWAALGEAQLALKRGDPAAAKVLLDEAWAYGGDANLLHAISDTRAQAGL